MNSKSLVLPLVVWAITSSKMRQMVSALYLQQSCENERKIYIKNLVMSVTEAMTRVALSFVAINGIIKQQI